MVKIIYVTELPENVIIRTENNLLVGTSQGVEKDARLCPKEG